MPEANEFCTNCGSKFGEGKFCVECGSPRVAVLAEGSKTPTFVGATASIVSDKLVAGKDLAENLGKSMSKAPEAVGDFFVRIGKAIASWFLSFRNFVKESFEKRTALSWALLTVSVLALGYGIAEAVIFGVVGPENTVSRYVGAITNDDQKSLKDETLFPSSNASEMSADLQPMRLSESNVSTTVIREYLSARVSLKGTDSLPDWTIQLASRVSWVGPLMWPEWVVITKAPELAISVESSLSKAQTARFGKDSTKPSTLEALTPGTFKVLPGIYQVTTGNFGFLGTSVYSAVALPKTADSAERGILTIDLASATVRPGFVTATEKAAAANVAHCAKRKCASMPRYSETDYDLWSKYDRSTYTSSSFDDHYNLSSCAHQSMVLVSPTRATMSSSCDVTASGHLYVKYVYYSGYFSDYWWYWNFYDTKSFSSTALTTVTVNPGGSGYKVRSVSIN